MSQILNRNVQTVVPNMELNGNINSVTLNALNETCNFIGYLHLDNPLSAPKTLSAAGLGSITWKAGTVTFANAGSTFKVGIQDVSTVSSPAQGDGTFDVEASFTGGGGGITDSSVNTSVMTSGTKALSHGQLISISFQFTALGGVDSIVVNTCGSGRYSQSNNMPCVTDNTSGSFAAALNSYPLAFITFDDGTTGWIYNSQFFHTVSNVTYNINTATADEYGNLIYLPSAFKVTGISFTMLSGSSSDFEVNLYSDPLGTPVLESSTTIDATQLGSYAVNRNITIPLTTPFLCKSYTTYAFTFRPTTTNNLTVLAYDGTTDGSFTGTAGDTCYAIRRLNNTGAFSDYNGGTAKTRLIWASLLGNYLGQDVGISTSQLGM